MRHAEVGEITAPVYLLANVQLTLVSLALLRYRQFGQLTTVLLVGALGVVVVVVGLVVVFVVKVVEVEVVTGLAVVVVTAFVVVAAAWVVGVAEVEGVLVVVLVMNVVAGRLEAGAATFKFVEIKAVCVSTALAGVAGARHATVGVVHLRPPFAIESPQKH